MCRKCLLALIVFSVLLSSLSVALADNASPDNQCPDTYFLCPDGSCVASQELCPQTQTSACPVGMILCPDGKCVESRDECYSSTQCPADMPFLCPDGTCVRSREECYLSDQCPANMPYLCPNGTCVVSLKECGVPREVILPEGCEQVVDPTGNIRIECVELYKPECPSETDIEIIKDKCEREGGFIERFVDSNGCVFVHCRFGEEEQKEFFQGGEEYCPTREDIERTILKCESLGLKAKIYFERGCQFATCLEEREGYCAEEQDPSIRRRIVEECRISGGTVISDFDSQGCPITRCVTEDFCRIDIPIEAVEKCKMYGGEIVTQTDDNGCINFFKCVMRGEADQSYIEPIKEVPSSTKLLQVALALETLVMKLDQLARQAEGLADYYESVGSSDEARFRTVAGMFRGVIDKVNSIRQGIRDNLSTMTIDYLEQVKHDIQYIKDVVLMDIVYVMLSSSDDYELPGTGVTNETSCGTDEQCFNNAFRICRPTIFYPEGEDNIRVEILGVEDDECVMHIIMSEEMIPIEVDVEPPYEMTCRMSDYAFGFNPGSDLSVYCEGNLVGIIEAVESDGE